MCFQKWIALIILKGSLTSTQITMAMCSCLGLICNVLAALIVCSNRILLFWMQDASQSFFCSSLNCILSILIRIPFLET